MDPLPDDPDTFAKLVNYLAQAGKERTWREISAQTLSQLKGKILQAVEDNIETGNARMEEISTMLRADVGNGPEAERLCRATVLDRQALTQKLRDSLLTHWCEEGGYRIPPVLGHFMVQPISLDSETDETSDDEPASHAANHPPTRNNGLQRKRARHDRPNSPESRARRARRDYDGLPYDGYDGPSPEVNTNSIHFSKTIPFYEVEGVDFIFQYPAIGPGYYVVRCEGPSHMHQFKEDPLQLRGRKAPRCVMIKHFARRYPTPKCHEKEEAETYTVDQIITKFGYRGNRRPRRRRRYRRVGRGGQRAFGIDRGQTLEEQADQGKAEGTSRTTETAAARFQTLWGSGGYSAVVASPSSSRSGFGAPATGPEAAGPSESRGFAPVADMDFGEIWGAQVANFNYASWNQSGEGGDMPPARIESDINPTEL
ncbi:hypothetical protein B0I37DRAFT_203026 [Chaetomium sp. MPI-CAGE-AT-0009]|nr:hypothetical protein B0I37DRAFT_203026 [Chaetomium sp. MPI-CAGE-AT-0009]